MEKDKPIAVYKTPEEIYSYCTRMRAAQMVYRKKAKWLGRNKILLVITKWDFQITRSKAMKRDKWRCYICDDVVTTKPLEYPRLKLATVDHRIPRSRGGSDELENVACCCVSCNKLKNDLKYEEFFDCLLVWVLWQAAWR